MAQVDESEFLIVMTIETKKTIYFFKIDIIDMGYRK